MMLFLIANRDSGNLIKLKGTVNAIVDIGEDIIDRLDFLNPTRINFALIDVFVEFVKAHQV